MISADSRQVYRGMDIGTGKDYGDYLVGGRRVVCHLIDIVEPGTEYNLYAYQRDFLRAYEAIRARNAIPILCGGSGLYLQAVLKGYRMAAVPPNPELRRELASRSDEELARQLAGLVRMHNVTDTASRERLERAVEIALYSRDHPDEPAFPRISSICFGIHFERDEIRERISRRLEARLAEGLVDEVAGLLKNGVSVATLKYYGLEYRCVVSYLVGELSWEAMKGGLNTAIHQFAKRQMTWFRKMEREGIVISWLDGHMSTEEKVREILARLPVRP
jgi:tRNA dimethylallyltransferase